MLKFWKKPDPTTALNAKIEVLETINAGLVDNCESLLDANKSLQDALRDVDERVNKFRPLRGEVLAERDAARDALSQIAGLETANCAHIGKKMAKIAREHLNSVPRAARNDEPRGHTAAEVGGVFVTSGISLADSGSAANGAGAA